MHKHSNKLKLSVNERAKQQRLQAEYQQRQANEIRVAEAYVKKPESQT
ncbi:hypothetical protein APHACPA_0379 [Rickettsia amblyommatis str. Ac/Pa]|uniref:Uncharacterized protein n=1 Tax=Rickettsia amblyommatis str. Ac/Pa TaxID=1359164 RepID=A0A0F3N383_RICAM|nr:hypothetical protein APHACPA_0379 [Rickettsia amblyommatis str. Ac/Pa]